MSGARGSVKGCVCVKVELRARLLVIWRTKALAELGNDQSSL